MLRQDSTKRYNQLAVDLLKKILIKQSTTGRYVTTDIQHLKNIRNRMLEQIKQNYQEEIRSYGSGVKNDGTSVPVSDEWRKTSDLFLKYMLCPPCAYGRFVQFMGVLCNGI